MARCFSVIFVALFVLPLCVRADPPYKAPGIDQLCVNGHPKSRQPNVIYGHKPIKPGCIRDHLWPLCGGGPDIAANVWYQDIQQSYHKDKLELEKCRAMCSGIITQDELAGYFVTGRWLDDIPDPDEMDGSSTCR